MSVPDSPWEGPPLRLCTRLGPLSPPASWGGGWLPSAHPYSAGEETEASERGRPSLLATQPGNQMSLKVQTGSVLQTLFVFKLSLFNPLFCVYVKPGAGQAYCPARRKSHGKGEIGL